MANGTHEIINIVETFERHKEGKSKNLYVLMSQLKDPTLPNDVLLKYLSELRQLVTTLNKDFEVLVGHILKVDWTARSDEVVEEYLQLMKSIVSVHTYYLSSSLKMIIDAMKPKNCGPATDVTDEIRRKNSLIFQRLHCLLSDVCKTVPMTPVLLIPLLTEAFPFYLVHDYVLECYVGNLLCLTKYLPKYRVPVLHLVISELTKLDVHAPVVDKDGSCHTDLKITTPSSEEEVADPIQCKLDALMIITFSYISETCYTKGVLDMQRTRKLFDDLIVVFDAVLLPTHASRYIQFIMFYICSFSENLAREFLESLWKKFEDPNIQSVFRQIAVLYIASYLVRAKNISTSTVKLYIDTLVAWARRYIKHSPQNNRPDVHRHRPFYAACQAIFYIFIYRHEELLHTFGLKYCESLYLGSIATSWLNPLRICMPQVAFKFASVVRNNRVAFCDTVLDRNRRCQLPEVRSVGDDAAMNEHIDTYFPFDPYTLPRSKDVIAEAYRNVESLRSEHRHRTVSEDVREEDLLYMESDENVDSYNTNDVKLYGTSPGIVR